MKAESRAPRVEVEIGDLVLHGFDPADRDAIAEGLRAELARLLGRRDGAASLSARHVDRIDAGAVEIPSGASPSTVGGRVAGAVVRSARP